MTLEDKLRLISDKELENITIKSIVSAENLSSFYEQGGRSHSDESYNYWFKDKVMTCEHCKDTFTRFGYQKDHGDMCPMKGIDTESLLKDWLDGLSLPQLQKKYGIAETSFQKYTHRVLPNRVRPCDELMTCKHCHMTYTKSNIIRSHNDKCKLKDGKYEQLQQDILDGMTLDSLCKKYGLSKTSVIKYKQQTK